MVGVTLDELSRGIGAVGGKRGTVENGDTERCVVGVSLPLFVACVWIVRVVGLPKSCVYV